MPSRTGLLLIVAFWLATTGLVVRRDVLPRLLAEGPPPIAIDLADEASQVVPVRWSVVRGGQVVGRVITQMSYQESDDTFRFSHNYKGLTIDLPVGTIEVPEVTAYVRVTRSGDLREQGLDGSVVVKVGGARSPLELPASAKVRGEVKDGVLVGRCEIKSPLGQVDTPLDPVPVPEGRVLNPLMPVNRLGQVRPGQRWVVPQVNPLADAAAAMLRGQSKSLPIPLPDRAPADLIADVLAEPQERAWKDKAADCWVIEYRADEVVARTWVRVGDGKVLRQEAFGAGERVTLEREE